MAETPNKPIDLLSARKSFNQGNAVLIKTTNHAQHVSPGTSHEVVVSKGGGYKDFDAAIADWYMFNSWGGKLPHKEFFVINSST